MLDPLPLVPIPAEAEALRAPVRAFVRAAMKNVPAHVRARSWSGCDPAFSRELGRRGWLGLTLPEAYGGGGRSAFARFVVVEELLNAGAPIGLHWVADRQSGPLIDKYGSEAQKARYLPPICRGESFFCIGMSEPNAGSDLAGVRTRATRGADGWRLSGQKIWTTNAHRCHQMIALVRTSGAADDRQRGLSQLIIDLSLPGVSIRAIPDLAGGENFCEVFFDDVALPAEALIGAEGAGWQQATAELAFERSGPERLYASIVLYDEWLAQLRSSGNAADAAESAEVAGRLLSHLLPLRAMSIAITEKLARGESPSIEAALVKDLGTELEQLMPAAIGAQLFGNPERPVPAELQKTLLYLTQVAPTFSLRGGTREILRGMIARGLGLR